MDSPPHAGLPAPEPLPGQTTGSGRSKLLASSHAGTRPPIAVQLCTKAGTQAQGAPLGLPPLAVLPRTRPKKEGVPQYNARTHNSTSTSLRRHDPHQVSGRKPNPLPQRSRAPHCIFRPKNVPALAGRVY